MDLHARATLHHAITPVYRRRSQLVRYCRKVSCSIMLVMRSRRQNAFQTILLFGFGALAILSAAPFLRAQQTNELPSLAKSTFHRVRFLLSEAQADSNTPLMADDPVIVNADLVTLTVSVVDGSGRSVTGLDKRAFTILDDNHHRRLLSSAMPMRQ